MIPSFLILTMIFCDFGKAQSSGAPSARCHASDGKFTNCVDGTKEWSDVVPQFFSETGSYLYADQADLDPLLRTASSPVDTLTLMYDECRQTQPLGPDEYFSVSFKTVEVKDEKEALEQYVVHIFPDGTIAFFENGVLQAPGRSRVVEGQRGSVGFGASPNCSANHAMAEFEIKLSAANATLNGGYSPEPIFWGGFNPPTPPVRPPPPPPPPGQRFTDAQKAAMRRGAAELGALTAGATFAARIICIALAPVVTPAVSATCVSLVTTAGGGIGAAAALLGVLSLDPPDPNFTVIAQPAIPKFSIQPVTTGPTISQRLADASNALYTDLEMVIGFARAIRTSVDRAEGARVAQNVFWEARQVLAVREYTLQLSQFLNALPQLSANFNEALQEAGIKSAFTASAIRDFQAILSSTGLPLDFVQALSELGVNDTDRNEIVQSILTANPDHIATFGAGKFPQMLEEPVVTKALRGAASALSTPTDVLFGTDASSGNLISVNPLTGLGSVIGPLRIGVAGALAIDASTGIMYAGGGGGSPNVYVVDRFTGTTTLLGNSGLGFAAFGEMDFDANSTLYASVNIAGDGGTGSDHLAVINKLTGAATIVGPFGSCAGVGPLPSSGTGSCTIEGIEAIAFDDSGQLWGAKTTRGRAGTQGLYKINTATGAALFVTSIKDASGQPPSGGIASLQFLGGVLFGGTATAALPSATDGGKLVTIDPSIGLLTFVGSGSATGGRSLGALAKRLFRDTDHDRVADESDNCPGNANADQLDTDLNGIGDICQQPGLSFTTAAFLQAGMNGHTAVDQRSVLVSDTPTLSDQISRIVKFRFDAGLTNSIDATISNLVDSLVTAAFISSADTDQLAKDVRQIVLPDTTPPTSTAVQSPIANSDGWNNSDVIVTLTAVDNPGGIGVKQITIGVAGQTGPTIVPGNTASVTVSTQGATTLSYFATDNAGNQEVPKAKSVQIDKTAPTLTGMPASGTILWPPNKKLVLVGVVSANDTISGVASFTLQGTSNEPMDSEDLDIVITGTGIGARQIFLRPDRLGNGTGRVYTLTARATDKAGNTVERTATVIVPHDQRKD